jgi:hypothetical protein
LITNNYIKGCGKTTLAKKLAKAWKCELVNGMLRSSNEAWISETQLTAFLFFHLGNNPLLQAMDLSTELGVKVT